jgi:hypothetical protein
VAEALEEVDDVRGNSALVVRGASNLLAPELEGHAQPVATSIGEPDPIRDHHIGLRDALRMHALHFLDRASEPAPSFRESLL